MSSIKKEKIDASAKSNVVEISNDIDRLQAIINTVVDGIISITKDGTIRSFNSAATKMFGYTSEEVIGKNVSILMPNPYSSEHNNYLNRYSTTHIKKVIGIGRESMETLSHLFVGETIVNGETIYIGTVRDITHHKRNEELIARLGSIVNDSSDEIYLLNYENLRFIQTNQSAHNNIGYNEKELKKLSFNDLLPKSTIKTFSRLLSQLNETGSNRITFETELKRKDGSTYPVEATIYLSSFGLEKVYVTIIQDITERKQTEKAIKDKNTQIELRSRYDRVARLIMAKSNATYDATEVLNESLIILANELDYQSSAIYLFDEWTGCLHLKASYAPPTGIKEIFRLGDGLVGQAATQNKHFVIDDINDDFFLSIDTGIMSIKPKAVIICPFSYQERIMGVICLASLKKPHNNDQVFIDGLLSQLAISLNSIKQYNDLKELSDQLKKRGREIAEKNAELEQANRMKSEFLANISHELRTPLNAVIGFSEVLKDGILGDLNDKQLEYSNDIFKSGQHLLSLINDILDLSKIEAGKMTLDPELVNMKELIRNSVSIVKERAFAKKIQLSQTVDDSLSPIFADARQIKQIVYNLLSNAVKFTPSGGKIYIEGYKEQNNYVIAVKDTGIGISEEDQKRLFKPFEQLDSSVARKYEGTGLGLVLAKRFAELHGGSVSVQSKPNEGSCFSIAIPYRTDENTESEISSPVVDETIINVINQQKDLLLLTTIKDNSKTLHHKAELQGYKVHKIFSSDSLIKHIKFSPPQLVVVDDKIPINESLDIIDKINTLSNSLPILFLGNKHSVHITNNTLNTSNSNTNELVKSISEYQATNNKNNDELKILVVDDDPQSVELISKNLEYHQYSVLRSYSGEEAIESAISDKPDIVILDLLMPNITGFDVIKALKNEYSKPPAIIVLTAISLSSQEKQQLNRDAYKIISKSNLSNSYHPEQDLNDTYSTRSSNTDCDNVAPVLTILTEDYEKRLSLAEYLHSQHFTANVMSADHLTSANNEVSSDLIINSYVHDSSQIKFYFNRVYKDNCRDMTPLLIYNNLDFFRNSDNDSLPDLFMDVSSIVGLHPHVEDPKTVLVIDDDVKAIDILASTLQEADFKVITANNGQEGLVYAKQYQPNAIIIDLVMSDLSGFDVVEGLKQDTNTSDIPTIVLTSQTLSDKEQELLSNHVDIIAPKYQTRRRELISNINELIEKRDLS